MRLANRRKGIDLPKHSHCIMCGVIAPEKETFCSDRCKEEYEKMGKSQRNMRIMILLPIGIVLIFFVVFFLLGGRR